MWRYLPLPDFPYSNRTEDECQRTLPENVYVRKIIAVDSLPVRRRSQQRSQRTRTRDQTCLNVVLAQQKLCFRCNLHNPVIVGVDPCRLVELAAAVDENLLL